MNTEPFKHSNSFNVSLFTLAIHFSHYDIHAAQNYHHIGDGVTKTKVFQHREINETRRTHPITVRIRPAVADQIKTEFAFRSFNTPVRLPDRRAKGADLHFRIHNRTSRDLPESLFQDFDALAHFEHTHHQTIVGIPMVAERHAKFEARIKAVAVHFTQVIVHPAGAQHRARDAGVNRQLGGKFPDVLRSRDDNFILHNQLFQLVDKLGEAIDERLSSFHPSRRRVAPAPAKTHVIAHHARTGERFEQIEDFLAFAERIHKRRTPGAHVVEQKSEQRRVILQSRQFC